MRPGGPTRLLTVVVLAAAVSTAHAAAPDAFTAAGIQRLPERPAPEFLLRTIDGQDVRLSDLRGKVVLLTFWATWCEPCKQEMPAMQRLQEAVGSDDFMLLAVTADHQLGAIRQFARSLNLSFPLLLDETKEVSAAYGVRGLPTTVLLHRDGRLVGRAVGPRVWDGGPVVALVSALLK